MTDGQRQPNEPRKSTFKAVVVGTSAGALEALTILLPLLPEDFSLPIVIVVHLPADKKSIMAECLRSKCQMNVHEAEDKEPLCPGTIYVAPPDYHLLIDPADRLSLSSEEPVRYSRPSIDVLFESAADVYGSELIGVILTGANNDGAKGLEAIVNAGGMAFVQRPDLANSRTMPQAAWDACPDAHVLSLPEIAVSLQELVSR